jgi:hypothetical protein
MNDTTNQMTRREMIEKFPPPYKMIKRDKHGRVVEGTKHNSLSSLELEVQVAVAKIADEKDRAASYDIDGIPKDIVLPKHQARSAP